MCLGIPAQLARAFAGAWPGRPPSPTAWINAPA
jgi:hypothetical protein